MGSYFKAVCSCWYLKEYHLGSYHLSRVAKSSKCDNLRRRATVSWWAALRYPKRKVPLEPYSHQMRVLEFWVIFNCTIGNLTINMNPSNIYTKTGSRNRGRVWCSSSLTMLQTQYLCIVLIDFLKNFLTLTAFPNTFPSTLMWACSKNPLLYISHIELIVFSINFPLHCVWAVWVAGYSFIIQCHTTVCFDI